MLKSQLKSLCNAFGNSSLPESERWKCIKYIFTENPIIDAQLLISKGELIYIDNSSIGAGFYVIGSPSPDFGITDQTERVVTFIPLQLVDKISFITTYINPDYKPDDDNDDDNPDDEELSETTALLGHAVLGKMILGTR